MTSSSLPFHVSETLIPVHGGLAGPVGGMSICTIHCRHIYAWDVPKEEACTSMLRPMLAMRMGRCTSQNGVCRDGRHVMGKTARRAEALSAHLDERPPGVLLEPSAQLPTATASVCVSLGILHTLQLLRPTVNPLQGALRLTGRQRRQCCAQAHSPDLGSLTSLHPAPFSCDSSASSFDVFSPPHPRSPRGCLPRASLAVLFPSATPQRPSRDRAASEDWTVLQTSAPDSSTD